MMSLIKMILLVSSSVLLNMKNPVKMSMLVLFVGSVMTLLMSKMTGNLWVPILVFLLFMGGILVVFMVISSIYPNDNPMKIKKSSVYLFMMLILLSGTNLPMFNESAGMQMKSILMSKMFLSGLIILLGLYFFLFVMILQKNSNSLRTFL